MIQSRYLGTIAAQIRSQNSAQKVGEFLDLMTNKPEKFELIIQGIQEALAASFNEAAANFNAGIGGTKTLGEKYNTVVSKLRRAFEAANKGTGSIKAVKNALDELYKLASNQSEMLSYYKNLKKDKRKFVSTMKDLMGYNQLRQKIEAIAGGQTIKNLGQGLTSNFTQPSEFFPQLIDVFGNGQVSKVVSEEFSQGLLGAGGKWIIDKDLAEAGITREIETKAADNQFIKKHLTVTIDPDNPNTVYDFYLAPFTSDKAYVGEKDTISMVSYGSSESSSILLDLLHSIYRSSVSDYQIYNSLVKQDSNDVLNQNFYIMRSDVTAYYAEKFIVGLNNESFNRTQSLLIYNLQAYPIISIISAIVKQGVEAMEKGRYYGNFEAGDLFRVNMVSVQNEWVGLKSQPSFWHKLLRIASTMQKIRSMQVQGKLNTPVLQHMMDNFNPSELQGIKIDID